MNNLVKNVLKAVQNGSMSVEDAVMKLKIAPFEDIGFAKVDLHRTLRQGAAEVIYGAGKTPEQITGIIDAMRKSGQTPSSLQDAPETETIKNDLVMT